MAQRWGSAALAVSASKIRPGDIIGMTPEGFIGKAIVQFQDWCLTIAGHPFRADLTEIVHVAVSLGGDKIVEAVPVHGVRVSSLRARVEPFAVYRPTWQDAASQSQKVCAHASGRVGADYIGLRSTIDHLVGKWWRRKSAGTGSVTPDIFICSTFVIRVFDDALADQSPFHRVRNLSRLPVFLPADVVAVPRLIGIPP